MKLSCVCIFLPVIVALNKFTDADFFCLSPQIVNQLQNEAVFKCCHDGLVHDYTWRINGVLYRNYTNASRNYCEACHSNCSISSTLTVPAVLEYNGIIVTCITFLSDGRLLTSDPVTLQVVNNSEHASQEFFELPRSTYVPRGLPAYFFCGLNMSVQLEWKVYDALLQEIHDSDHFSRHVQDKSWSVLVVNTSSSSVSNRFTVRCQIRGNPCRAGIITPPSQLRIQGYLNAPTGLDCKAMGSMVECNGTQQYSRNLTERNNEHLKSVNIDAEIKYHVCVHNLTCGEMTLRPECKVTKLPFTLNNINNGPFRVTVTPLSNMNATPAEFEENYGCFNCGVVVDLDLTEVINESYVAVSIERYELQGVIPERFSLRCMALKMERAITFEVNYLTNITHINLPIRDIFMCQFTAYGCYDGGLLPEINTYDIYNVSITSPQPGILQVSLNFIPNSSAAGVLLIIARNESQIDYRYLSVIREPSQQYIQKTINNITDGNQSISVFVLEESGLPFRTTFVSSVLEVNPIIGPPRAQQIIIEYTLNSNSTGVCVHCTFLSESISDCVAVVHRSLTQHDFNGLINIESSHKFTRSGDTASGCIVGVNLEDYQIGVIDGTAQASRSIGVMYIAVPAVSVTVGVLVLISITVGIAII